MEKILKYLLKFDIFVVPLKEIDENHEISVIYISILNVRLSKVISAFKILSAFMSVVTCHLAGISRINHISSFCNNRGKMSNHGIFAIIEVLL